MSATLRTARAAARTRRSDEVWPRSASGFCSITAPATGGIW